MISRDDARGRTGFRSQAPLPAPKQKAEKHNRIIYLYAVSFLVHNHPSGDPTPSQADVKLTRELVEAGRHMKVAVHDHVIVGTQGQSSLRAMGLM